MYRGGRDQSVVEDMIPYTNLNICHKKETSQKRCFTFGYKVTVNIVDAESMIVPKLYAKISFKKMNSKMLILAGDRVGIRFGEIDAKKPISKTDTIKIPYEHNKTPFEAIRITPDIASPKL